MEEDRITPEELLESIQKEASQQQQGKLKIFLGMAAGVGKTYAMLEAAQRLKQNGSDVVIGVVSTHGRKDTERLTANLPIIPEKKIIYKDSSFSEMDIDAILARKPQIVLVDELAHTNIPGSRHPKRWQDVMEILDHGIDVYTTLNVQHIESLKDLVEKITGITIRETIPDRVIETAAHIELIDLTPGELRQRLKDGKVYLGNQSRTAAENFFQEDRLTALREIVLRYAAEKIDHDLKEMVSTVQRPEAWKTRERLLVAVSHSPHSQKLIRITRRLAFNLDAPWLAVHVNTGQVLTPEDQEMLSKNLALARDLGAEVITTDGINLVQAIERLVRLKSVTQIIIGRSPTHWLFDCFRQNSLINSLANECSDIDLHVIRQTMSTKPYRKKWNLPRISSHLSSYFYVVFLVALITLASAFFLPYIGYKALGFLFLLSILSMSLFFKKGPLFLATLLFAGIWTFLFFPVEDGWPTLAFNEDLILLIFYFITALFTGILTDRAKAHKEILAKQERTLAALYEVVREIASAPSFDAAITSVKENLNAVLNGSSEILIKDIDNGIVFDDKVALFQNGKERAAATWVFQNGKEAGHSTSTLPFAQCLYLPLQGSKEIEGVLAYRPKEEKNVSEEEKNFLHTVGHQLASYIERSFSEERARRFEQHKQVEKIYESILHLLANLFEGPLLTLQDGIKQLKKGYVEPLTPGTISPLEVIETSSKSLSNILENISAMVNLSAGLMPIKKDKHDIKELVNRCYQQIQKSSELHYRWSLHLEETVPLIHFDYDLIELVFYNLTFHAMEFATPESAIEISAALNGDYVTLSISGEGQSIPDEFLDVAFEKFYRIPSSTASGLGLGLAIAKTIAAVHGGHLRVQNREGGGMMFILFLPIN